MPGFGDEMNYLIQAKVFSAGKFFIKEPPNPEFFKVDWMNIFSEDKINGINIEKNNFEVKEFDSEKDLIFIGSIKNTK